MKLKQRVKSVIVGVVISLAFLVAMPVATEAADCSKSPQCCAGQATAIIACTGDGTSDEARDTGIFKVLLIAINILTAGVGIASVAGIVWASIQYASAGPNADQIKKAKNTITNIVIGIIAFALMYAFLNFIIPGGLFA